MSIQTDSPDTPREQDNLTPSKTARETNLDRIANKAASRAGKRQQRYEQEHNIFTK
jgi:hypothetical protein